MNLDLLIGLIGLFLGMITLTITFYKVQQSNNRIRKEQVREFTQLADKVLDNEKNIAKLHDEMKLQCNAYQMELEKVKADRADRVRQVYAEIEALRKMQESTSNDLYESLERAIDKTTSTEERHHSEVMTEIRSLTVQVTTMCATFAEYRKTRNGYEKKE